VQRLNPYYRGTCDFDERLRDHNFPKVNYVRQIEFCGRRGAEPHRGRLGHLHGGAAPYRGTSLIRKRSPLGPYRRAIPRVLGGSEGGGRFLMGEVPLYLNQTKLFLRLPRQVDHEMPFKGFPDPVLGAVTQFLSIFGENCPCFLFIYKKNDL